MATYRVKAPDGSTYRVTAPDGASPEEVKARVKARVQAQHKSSGGLLDTLNRGLRAVRDVVNDSGNLAANKLSMGITDRARGIVQSLASGQDYSSAQADVDQRRSNYQASHPGFDWGTLPLNIMGAPVNAVEGLAAKFGPGILRQAAGVGGTMGAISGAANARGSLGDQAMQTVKSTIAGTVAGPVLAKTVPALLSSAEQIAAPVVRQIGKVANRFQRPVQDAAEDSVRNIASPQPAVRKIIIANLAKQGMTPKQAGQMIDAARSRGVPLALMDTGDEMRGLAAALSRKPGSGRTIMRDAVLGRQEGQTDRVQSAIQRDLGPVANVYEASDALSRQAKDAAGPLYQRAFQGGSIAPLEAQFQQAFNQSSADVAAARKAVVDGGNALTQARSRMPTAQNVYATSAANRGGREADQAMAGAQARLADAEARHTANLDRLRQAQADGTANAPGAIWSPRIQQFLDDPITKAGLKNGLEVQRLEALAEGKPFSPTEYAVVGTGQDGSPIVGSVPNMRTLDAVKVGLDNILEQYPRGPAGNLLLDPRGRAVDQVRKAFLKEMDGINPDYASARAAYAGPSKMRGALAKGQAAINASADDIAAQTSRMTDAEIEQYKLGLRSGISKMLEGKPDDANKVRALVGTPKKRAALAKLFGGDDAFGRFMATLADEQAAALTHGKVNTGSSTASNFADDATLDGPGGIMLNMAGRALGGRGMISNGLETLRDAVRYGTGKSGEVVRSQLASGLSETRPEVLAARLRLIQELNRKKVLAGAKNIQRGRKIGGLSGGVGAGNLLTGGNRR